VFRVQRVEAVVEPTVALLRLGIRRRPGAIVDYVVESGRVLEGCFAALPEAVDRLVARERDEPGLRRGERGVEARGAAPHGRVDLLQDLFRLVAIPQHAQAHPEQACRAEPVQRLERLGVAGAGLAEQALEGGSVLGRHRRSLNRLRRASARARG
jgi:hypothetical protein